MREFEKLISVLKWDPREPNSLIKIVWGRIKISEGENWNMFDNYEDVIECDGTCKCDCITCLCGDNCGYVCDCDVLPNKIIGIHELSENHTYTELCDFLRKLKFIHNEWVSTPFIPEATIVFSDGSWVNREIYQHEGAEKTENWIYHKCPEIPDHLRKKSHQ
jgi:hypothetical protein